MAQTADLVRDTFLAEHGIAKAEFETTGLTWAGLDAIRSDHEKRIKSLARVGEMVAMFLRDIPAVHSVKMRVKNADHLVAKIIRKRIEEPERVIDATNYKEQITDLVGVRALHLFKQDWPKIHAAIFAEHEFNEDPVAYHRNGDTPELLEQFKTAGCKTEVHKRHYRSVHYLLKTQVRKGEIVIVEAQVRTVFEEGWAEIDHEVRYPRKSDDELISGFIGIFNMLAGGADEMASFLLLLKEHLSARESETASALSALQTKTAELDQTIAQLQLTEGEKEKLKQQIAGLTAAKTPPVKLKTVADQTVFGTLYESAFEPSITPKKLRDLLGVTSTTSSALDALAEYSKRQTHICPNGHTWSSSGGILASQFAVCPTCKQSALPTS